MGRNATTGGQSKKPNSRNTINKTTNRRGWRRRKEIITIGTWNIRTLLQVGKMNEVADQAIKNKIDITALQEVRWKGEGEVTNQNYTLFYSGGNKQGKNGVGFIVTNKFRKHIIEHKAHSDRISYIRIKMATYNVTLVNVYAPPETTNNEEKEQWYEKLEEVYEQINNRDTIIIAGDYNAQVGKEECNSKVAGKYTIHEKTNDNGTRLCNFAASNGFIIASTKFNHKHEDKVTWNAPGGRYSTQIDHILIREDRQSLIEDVYTEKAANVETDHFMVVAKVRIKKTNQNKKQSKKARWSIDKLKQEEVRAKYEEEMEKELESQESGMEVREKWMKLKACLNKTAQNVLGTEQKQKQTQWWNEKCKELVRRKTEARDKYMKTGDDNDKENYRKARNEANHGIREVKNQWMNHKLQTAENQMKNNNTRKFYQDIKKMNTIKSTRQTTKMKNKHGKTAETEEEEKQIWEEYFKTMLTEDKTQRRNLGVGQEEERCERNEQISIAEQDIKEIIKKLKNGKTPGPDGINNELIKYGGNRVVKEIHELINQIWDMEHVPEEWGIGAIYPIHKKGDKQICDNYRGITLLNSTYKMLTTTIHNKLMENITIPEYQNGFAKGKSTIDAIHMMKQILQKTTEHNQKVIIIFIDFKKAFDSINRQQLMGIIHSLEIPTKVKAMINVVTEKTTTSVITRSGQTREFETNIGIRQGDILSATLFTIVIEHILRNIQRKGTLRNKPLQIIAYADDITVIAKQKYLLEETMREIMEEGRKIGLYINTEKTKVMITGDDETSSIKIGNHMYECVKTFKYLGVTINKKGTNTDEIAEKIQAAHRAYYVNRKSLTNKTLRRKTKLGIYKTIIRPILMYAAETLTLTKQDRNKIEIAERAILRKLTGPNKMDDGTIRRKTNQELEDVMEGENIIRKIKKQRLRWAGHIMRMDPDTILRQLTDWQPTSNRKRGRPRENWLQQVEDDLKHLGITEWKKKARNRRKWREFIKQI